MADEVLLQTLRAEQRLPARRILLVDDHPIVLEGLRLFLDAQSDLVVCGQASSPAEAMALLSQVQPELAIVDLNLGDSSGLDLIRWLHRQDAGPLVLAMSMHDEDVFAARAIDAGASGYLMKQQPTREVLRAVRLVLSGDVYLSPALQSRLLRGRKSADADKLSAIAGLSPREFEVLHLMGLGQGTRQIADQLRRSVKTIEAHRANLKLKLNLQSGVELMHFAVRWQAGRTGGVMDSPRPE